MMVGIYDDMRRIASGIFAEFKQGVVRYIEMQPQEGATPDDPGTPVSVPHLINATARPVSTEYVDGTHIVQSDREVMMPNDGITPTMDGYVEIDGDQYKIIEVMPRPAAGTPITFTLVVRR